MRAWPFLKLAIPLGTLAALALGYGIQQLASEADPPINIQRPPPTTFKKLRPPVHGHKLAGQVTTPTGDPVDRALVWLRSGDEPSFTYSDAQGAFRFEALGAGPWPTKVIALGFEPLDLTLQESAALQRIAFKKAYGPPPQLAVFARAPLAGRILVPPGFDASRFEVVLLPEEPTRIDSAVPRRVECDAQGAFRLEDLIVAHYDLRVLPAWARGGSWPDLLVGVGAGTAHDFTHQQAGGELVLRLALGTIEGTLLEPITKGLDGAPLPVPHDVPVEGALVELEQQLPGDTTRLWLPQSTDATGGFALHALPEGVYLLTLRAGEFTLSREVQLGSGETKRLELRLVAPAAGN